MMKLTKFRIFLFVIVAAFIALSWDNVMTNVFYPPSYYVMTKAGDTWAGPYYPLTPAQLAKCNDAAQSMSEYNPAVVLPTCAIR